MCGKDDSEGISLNIVNPIDKVDVSSVPCYAVLF